MEAQRVARAWSRRPTSPGHDSSDNSTGKRIVDKLKSDVKGLKNVLRKSRRNTRPEESLELQPLAPKVPALRRQQKIDESQDLTLPNSQETPAAVSPLGAGLPLLSRLRLLKEKEEREERRNLMDTPSHVTEPQAPPPSEALNPTNPNLPFLQRILLLKAKNEQEAAQTEKEVPINKEHLLPKKEMPINKEHLLPNNAIPEETSTQSDEQPSSDQSGIATIAATATSQVETTYAAKKSWVALKKASLMTKENSSQKSPPARKLQQTKMYASVDDLSPEYCGLPFVKKLKILNERQKLAELEKAVRSSSLDCGENTESEFDSNLTRSHSEACAIEYARKLAKYNQARQASVSSVEQLSPENETLERRNLKSILKKLSASSSRASSSETSATSTPDRQAATAELKKLMRAPTIEGYAARHSKLSKSVTFNKYTLQSPPSEQPLQPPSSNSGSQDQPSLSPPNKLTISFRPVGSAGILQTVSRPREEECLGELLSGVGEVIKAGLEDMQSKFVRQFTSLESEVRKRDEIISQLQSRIQQLERKRRRSHDDDSGGDSTEHDASMEEDLDEDCEDHPFMRDSSVDTVLTARLRDRRSSVGSSSRSRRSWEEHSERETLELQELPNSIMPQRLSREDVAIDLESNSDSRSDEEFDVSVRHKGDSDEGDEENEEEEEEEDDEDDDDDKITRQDGYNNWEVALLAKQLEARRRSGDNASPGS
ncbi:hypothetical protein EAG_13276 [Camponotus floridanus]|uniref:Uncharacterized protein n=3 Tax=Camponotus floridanus TaxID=104421 RepID=E2AED2_CAMFO|nr:hypothetical protein EAG_13276 [Camponotus floridanus]